MGKYHPVAKVFRDSTKAVSKEHVARAAKLLHGLATESTARGYEVTLPSSHKRTDTRRPTTLDGDTAITIGSTTVPLEMRELPPNGGSARPYISKYNSRNQSWTLVNNTDFVSTGRLQLELTQKYSTNGRRERFRDGKFDVATGIAMQTTTAPSSDYLPLVNCGRHGVLKHLPVL